MKSIIYRFCSGISKSNKPKPFTSYQRTQDTFRYKNDQPYSFLNTKWKLDSNTIIKIIQLFKVIQPYQFTITDKLLIPKELTQYFSSFEAYQQFIDYTDNIILTSPDLANKFQLDIYQYIELLNQHSKISSLQLKNEHFSHLLGQVRVRYRPMAFLVQTLRLSISQPDIINSERKDLVQFLVSLPTKQSNENLFSFCISTISSRVTNGEEIQLEEATGILQVLTQLNILGQCYNFNVVWIQKLVQICIDSIQEKSDWKNLIVLCLVFAKQGERLQQVCCNAISTLCSIGSKNILREAVVILWTLGHVTQKHSEYFVQALQAFEKHQNLKELVLNTQNLSEQVMIYYSLQKIILEQDRFSYLREHATILYTILANQINLKTDWNNLSQFYIASLRLNLLPIEVAQDLLPIIIQQKSNPQMLGLCIYETHQKKYYELIKQQIPSIRPILGSLVNEHNVSNLFIVLGVDQDCGLFLYKKAVQYLPRLTFSQMELISEKLRTIKTDESDMSKAEFDKLVVQSLLQQIQDPLDATRVFINQEQQVVSLLMSLESDLRILRISKPRSEFTIDDKETYENFLNLLLKILDFYVSSQLKNPQSNSPKGLGNLFYLTEKWIKKQQKTELYEHMNWFLTQTKHFDILELLNLYKGLVKIRHLTPDQLDMFDQQFLSILQTDYKLQKSMRKLKERFIYNFTRYHRPSYNLLVQTNTLVNQLQEKIDQSI